MKKFQKYKISLKKGYYTFNLIKSSLFKQSNLREYNFKGIFLSEDNSYNYFLINCDGKSTSIPQIKNSTKIDINEFKIKYNEFLFRNVAGVLSIKNYKLIKINKDRIDSFEICLEEKLKDILNR